MSAPRSAKVRPSSSACPSDRFRITGTEIVATRRHWLMTRFGLAGLAVAIAVAWGGCTTIKSVFSPPPAPKVPIAPPSPLPPKKEPVAPAPIKKEPEAPPAPKKGPETPPAQKEEPPPPMKAPLPPPAAPPVKKEPVAPAPIKKEPEAPPAPKKAPETPTEKKESEAPPPVLAPQVGKGGEDQLKRTAGSRIQATEQLIGQLEGKSLTSEQQERLMTVRSLVGSAKEALAAQDLTKASNLADKARLLAEELTQSVK
jgi:hypothetical protein